MDHVSAGWSVQKLQDTKAKAENVTDTDEPLCTTIPFIVSSSQISPEYDMCVSVTINGGKKPHTVTVEKKASWSCVCQVFYQREEINCWKTTLAFCYEHLLDGLKSFYHDSNVGPAVYFYLIYGAKTIDISISCEKKEWCIQVHSEQQQVSRAAVEGYTGEGEPPCIVMTLRTVSDETKPPNLTLPVTLTGVREPNNIIVIERPAEDRTWHVCQVFYHKKGVNHWTATLAFCHKKQLNRVKEHYQNAADIGPIIGLRYQIISMIKFFDIDVKYSNTTDGWNIDSDKQCQVSRESITRYTGEGEPPCIVMTLRAVSDETTPPNLILPVTLTEVNEANKNTILIKRTAEDPTGCVCQVFYHKKNSNNWTVTLAFCLKNKFNKMKEFYRGADIGPTINVKFKTTSHITPNIRKVIGGWTLVPDNQLKQVGRAAVEGYTGEGEPPCIVMTLSATNKAVSIHVNFTVTLDGAQPPNAITITRPPDAANFQTELTIN